MPQQYPLHQSTILFCDLERSTDYAVVLGEGEYGDLLYKFQSTCAEVAGTYAQRRSNRTEIDIRGDQLCTITWEASDEDCWELLCCAFRLKLIWLLSDYNRARVADQRSPVQLAIGLHTGQVVLGSFPRVGLGSNRTSPEGLAISLAKRVEGAARQGQCTRVMLTDPMIARCRRGAAGAKWRGDFQSVPRGEVSVTPGLRFPIHEVVDGSVIAQTLDQVLAGTPGFSLAELMSWMQDVERVDPSSWTALVQSEIASMEAYDDMQRFSREQSANNTAPFWDLQRVAVERNPESIDLPLRLAWHCLAAGRVHDARDLIEQGLQRRGARRMPQAWPALLRELTRAIEGWETESTSVDGGMGWRDRRTLEELCRRVAQGVRPTLGTSLQDAAAGLVFSLAASGGVRSEEISRLAPEQTPRRFPWMWEGLDLLQQQRAGNAEISHCDRISQWEMDQGTRWRNGRAGDAYHHLGWDTLQPLWLRWMNDEMAEPAQDIFRLLQPPFP